MRDRLRNITAGTHWALLKTTLLGLVRMNGRPWLGRRLFCLIYVIHFFLIYPAFTSGAEISNIVVKSSREDLLIDLTIKGVFTKEMKKALLSGIPVSFTFVVLLYEANAFWFNNKIASVTAIHKIQYDSVENEYTITRSWEKTGPLKIKNFEKARILMAAINSLKIIDFTRLKIGKHYQLRVKSELEDKKFPFFGFPWKFETDWYTINFIY